MEIYHHSEFERTVAIATQFEVLAEYIKASNRKFEVLAEYIKILEHRIELLEKKSQS